MSTSGPTRVGDSQIVIEPVELNPNPIRPGDDLTVAVSLKETAEIVSGKGLCNPDNFAVSGIATFVTVDPSWAGAQDRSVCVPMFNLTAGRAQRNFVFTVPELAEGVVERTFSLSISVQVTGTGETAVITRDVIVSESAQGSGCTTNGDCSEGFECDNGECVPVSSGGGDPLFPNIPGGAIENLAILAVLFVGFQAVEQAADVLGEPSRKELVAATSDRGSHILAAPDSSEDEPCGCG